MKIKAVLLLSLSLIIASSTTYAFEISSGFGWRINPITKKQEFHRGIDIPLHTGTPVFALFDGIVVWSAPRGGYGNCIIIKHDTSIYTLYGHNSILCVAQGQKVKAGDVISRVGSTGMSTGPHLHLEFWYNNQYQNPLVMLKSHWR